MKKFGLIAVLFLGLTAPALSHPHVFITGRTVFVFDRNRLTGMEVQWEFDPMFSSQIITSCDKNSDGRFDAVENGEVKAGFFQNLKNFDYFTQVWVNNIFKRTTAVTGFQAAINGDKVSYTFFIPLNIPLGSGEISVKAAFSDSSSFVAFTAPARAITVRGPKPVNTSYANNEQAQFQIRTQR